LHVIAKRIKIAAIAALDHLEGLALPRRLGPCAAIIFRSGPSDPAVISGERSVMDLRDATRARTRIPPKALQFHLGELVLLPVVCALCFAVARWWREAAGSALVMISIAAISVRLRRLAPVVLLGCYVAIYACLIRHDPDGRSYRNDYEQVAANYRVLDSYCQFLYGPLELIDRETRWRSWHFDCVW
jgi:hypothetical protein